MLWVQKRVYIVESVANYIEDWGKMRILRAYCEGDEDGERNVWILWKLTVIKTDPEWRFWKHVVKAMKMEREWRHRWRWNENVDFEDGEDSMSAQQNTDTYNHSEFQPGQLISKDTIACFFLLFAFDDEDLSWVQVMSL